MKKRLRLLAWLITLTMLCELLPFSAFAQSDIAQTLVQRRVSASSLDEQNDLSSVTFEGGTGTPEDPYQIATAEQLDAIRNNLSASYILLNDIDLSSYGNWVPIGDSSSSGFTGTLDGNGHSIQNMTITSSGLDYSAFIGSALNATVKNLSLENVDIEVSDTHCVAGIIGSAVDNCIIESCSVSGNIRVTTARVELLIGGIAGNIVRTSSSSDPQISNSVNRAAITVDGPDFTTLLSCGGIAGYSNATISSCDNYGEIHSISDNSIFAGGIVGDCSASVISCKNFGTVYGQSNKETYTVAGIAGRASVSYCVNSGSVHGHSQSGSSYGGNATGINGLNSSSARFCYNIAANIDSTYGDDSSLSVAYRIGCGSTRYNCYSLDSTLVNGAVTTEYASTAMVNGESLSYDEILSRIKEIFPDFELEPAPDIPDPEPSKEFTFKRDNLSFLNSGDDFFYGNSWDFKHPFQSYYEWLTGPSGNYNISSEAFERLTSPYVPRVVNYLKEKALAKWDGSCSGMSTVVALHYVAPERFPLNSVDASASNVYDLKAPKDDSSVEDLINYYQLLQLTPTMHKLKCDRFYFTAMHFEDSLNEVITELQSGYPVVIGLARNNKFSHGTHAVVLLSLIDDKETSNYYIARVYDPNKRSKSTMKIYKAPYDSKENSGIKISYGLYHLLYRYILTHTDLKYLDIHNFFGLDNNETAKDFDKAFIKSDGSIKATYGKYFVRTENGELVECSSNVTVFKDENTLAEYVDSDDEPDICDFDITFDDIPFAPLELHLDSSGVNNASVLLKDTLLSISTTGPADLVYNETARTLDITAENPTDVSLLFTQNGVSTNWPWHSWVIDTTGATEFHASMDDEGLHLNGDGISNAKYATEYMGSDGEDDVISKGTIPAGADNVTIVNKNDGNSNTTDIETPDPVEPAELTVSVSGGTIIQINDDAFAESLTSHTAKQGDKITIMADTTDKFNGWIVNEGDVTLDDSSASPTSFTMGDKAVSITAQYSTNSTPTPTPGGGSSSGGGGGGGGGGAAVLIGVGAAAAITAGVIMMSPVDVKGRVVLANQAAVPGAKLSLLHEGKVVAQTTADENGNFSLKAKRGSYELTAAYTNADGQLIYKTIDIKAPAKDLTVTF